MKEIIKYSDGPANIIGYGFGPGYKQLLCTIIPCKLNRAPNLKSSNLKSKIRKLGFYKGVELPDPKKLLAGSGKVHQYVEIRTENDVKDRAIKKFLNEALKAYRKRLKTI